MDRPILFSAPMVRAILDGSKSATRRPVKPSPGFQRTWLDEAHLTMSPSAYMCGVDGDLGAQFAHPMGGPLGWVRCPFGAVGDRLWVRETWAPADQSVFGQSHDSDPPQSIIYQADNEARIFRSDGSNVRAADPQEYWPSGHRWKPSIHMSRWASRLTLDVVSVRVERLHTIDEADARLEGFGSRAEFAGAWEAIYGSWERDPWVWRIEWAPIGGGR